MVKIEVIEQEKKKERGVTEIWWKKKKKKYYFNKKERRMIYNIIIIYNFEATVGCQRLHSIAAWMLNIIAIASLMETYFMVWAVKK